MCTVWDQLGYPLGLLVGFGVGAALMIYLGKYVGGR